MRGYLVDFDWSEIILDLRRAGMGQTDIARAMGHAVGEAMIRQYLAGAAPIHWRGELLLDLWEKQTGKERENAPKRPAEMRRSTPKRPRQRTAALMPTEHLPAVARAYNITVPALLQILSKKTPSASTEHECGNLTLPGFEE